MGATAVLEYLGDGLANAVHSFHQTALIVVGNESVPKFIMNDTLIFLNCDKHLLLILKHKSFRVLFDKVVFVYFLKNIFIF